MFHPTPERSAEEVPDATAEATKAAQVGLADRLLRVPLSLKIVLANAVIAPVAGLAALFLAPGLVAALPAGSAAMATAVFVVAVLALSTLLNAIVLKVALTPLAHLATTAERVRRGDLSARAPLSRLADPGTRGLVILFNRMMDALQAGRRRQKELARRILETEEGERARIADELYAGPAQSLAGVMVRLRLAARRGPPATMEGPTLEEEIRAEVAHALEEIRSLARRLHPPELGELGVRAALEAHARALTDGRDVRVTIRGDEGRTSLPPGTATVLYRILQEAVTDSVVHSGGRSVEVELTPRAGRLVAEVRDDGRGFDPLPRIPGRGLGIPAIRERASYAGGTVTVASSEGGGARVRVELPMAGTPWPDDVAQPVATESEPTESDVACHAMVRPTRCVGRGP